MEPYLCREDAPSKESFFLVGSSVFPQSFFRRLTTNVSWLSL